MKFLHEHQIAAGVVPVNLATLANDGDWVSLKLYQRLIIILFKGAGTAGEDPTLTLEQAQDVAGTGAKALAFEEIYSKQGADLFTIGEFTKITQAAAATYTHTDGAEQMAIWVVEVLASQLDVKNDFDCVRARVADVGVGAQLGGILYILADPRYASEIMPSAIGN